MGYLELGEIDRKKYDLPERIEFLHHRYGMRSIKALRKATGYEYEMMTELVAGVPKIDPKTNEPIFKDVTDAEGGAVYEDDGVTPKRELALTHDEDAFAAFLWLVLWDNGYHIEWSTFNPHYEGLRLVLADDNGEEESGKAPEDSSSTTTVTSD